MLRFFTLLTLAVSICVGIKAQTNQTQVEETHWRLEELSTEKGLFLLGAQSSTGRDGKGLFFSGKASAATVATEAKLVSTQEKVQSISLWFKSLQQIQKGKVVSSLNPMDSLHSFSIEYNASGMLRMLVRNSQSQQKSYLLGNTGTSWTHLTWVIEGKNWTIYLNGEKVWADTNQFVPKMKEIHLGGKGYKGYIDEIVMSSKVWTAQEVKQQATKEAIATEVFPRAIAQLNHIPCKGGKGSIVVEGADAPQPYTYQWKDLSVSKKERKNLVAGTYTLILRSADGMSKEYVYPIGQQLEWVDSVGVHTEGQRVLKDNYLPNGWGNAGLAAHNALEETEEGFVTFLIDSASEKSVYRIGFSYKNEDVHHHSLPFGIQYEHGKVSAWHYSTLLSEERNAHIGDVLSIQRKNNQIYYFHNQDTLVIYAFNNNQQLTTNNQRLTANSQQLTNAQSSPTANNQQPIAINNLLQVDFSLHTGNLPIVGSSACRPILIESQSKSLDCQGQSKGHIKVKAIGGSGKFSYTWQDNASTTRIRKDLTAGNYKVIIKDQKTGKTKEREYVLSSKVSWKEIENAKETNSSAENEGLEKTDSLVYWGVSGASSSNLLSSETDGWVSWTVLADSIQNPAYSVGLSYRPLGWQPSNIMYRYVYENERLSIYKGEDLQAEIGRIQAGTSLKISRDALGIHFWVNGEKVHSLAHHYGLHFYVHTAIRQGLIPSLTASFCQGSEHPQADSLASLSLPNDISTSTGNIEGSVNGMFGDNEMLGEDTQHGNAQHGNEGSGERMLGEDTKHGNIGNNNYPRLVEQTSSPRLVSSPNETNRQELKANSQRLSTFSDPNYVREFTAKVEGLSANSNLSLLPKEQVLMNTQYIDGLGRPIQTVSKAASPTGNDVVQIVEYDAFGRQPKNYLPYVASTGTGEYRDAAYGLSGEQMSFYAHTTSKDYATTIAPYTLTGFEASPLNRPLWTAAQGDVWAGAYNGASVPTYATDFQERPNVKSLNGTDLDGDIRVYTTTDKTGLTLFYHSKYADGALWVKSIKDETAQNNEVLEFTDKQGKVILKRVKKGLENLDTYYIYDDWGNLRVVLPPMASQNLATAFTSPNTTLNILAQTGAANALQLLYRYDYDARNRVILKKVPSAGEVLMVYDKLDRLIMSQDAVQRTNNQWTFTKYDALNRPVMTGIWEGASSQTTLQTAANASIVPNVRTNHPTSNNRKGIELILSAHTEGVTTYEAKKNITILAGFELTATSNVEIKLNAASTETGVWVESYYDQAQTIPNLSTANKYTLLTISHYDDYDFDNDGDAEASYNVNAANFLNSAPHNVGFSNALVPTTAFAKPTGSITSTRVKDLDNQKWLKTTTFYDEKGRVLQTQADNHLGGKDILTNRYDFEGKALQTATWHKKDIRTPLLTLVKTFTYDHAGRMLLAKQSLNSQTAEVLSTQTYNTLGQVKRKNVGNVEDIDYQYHIRGWLSSINNVNTLETDNKLFAFGLHYESNPLNMIDFVAQHNGNIAATVWKTHGADRTRAYAYSYDNLNRLLSANYQHNTSGTWLRTGEKFDEIYTYDNMGNLKTLKRFGLTTGTSYGQIANYELWAKAANINQMTTLKSYQSGITDSDLTYNANGSQLTDTQKGIENTFYNHLNLARQINFVSSRASNGTFLVNRIEFGYDATGVKLWKKVIENNVVKSKTDYLGEFHYENNVLQFIHTSEGRMLANGNSFTHEYHYKDHLGNLRLVFGKERSWLMTSELDKKTSEEAFFSPINTYRSSQQYRTGTQAVKLALNQQIATALIDTRKNNNFQLELFAFSTTSSTGARESETMQFNTPLLTNSYLPNNEGTARLTPNLNLLSLLKFIKQQSPLKKENKSNERSTATYTVRLKVEYYSNTKALINSSVQDFSLSSGTWQIISPTSINISQTNIAYVKFIVLNPNSFPIFIDDWSIKESGKVILQENHYYPYGKEISSLGKKGTHEFLYQGKERNEEFGLEQDDFEWRMYDFNFPRTTTIDPHSENYYALSPYSWVAGNPIKFIDPDGRDFILQFDHKNKTVTVSATYYASGKDFVYANDAVDFWNSQSGNFSYEVDGAGSYSVNFNLKAVDALAETLESGGNLVTAVTDMAEKDKSGGANTFQIASDNDSRLINKNGTTYENDILIKDSAKNKDSAKHEFGHTLGMVHNKDQKSLMRDGGNYDGKAPNPLSSDIQDMITYPVNGKVNKQKNSTGQLSPAGRGTVVDVTEKRVRSSNQFFSLPSVMSPIIKNGKVK
jgi:RHS repeat-associated protein